MVGRQVARLVQEMEFIFKDRSIRSRTHIIGFSLGAHTAGNAGMYFAREAKIRSTNKNKICTKLHQISGLDPAGPLFERASPSIRLDPSDACYVDVIHTNAGSLPTPGLGIRRPCGNVDFYPNGGSRQPECRHLIIGAFNQCELGKKHSLQLQIILKTNRIWPGPNSGNHGKILFRIRYCIYSFSSLG